MEKQGADQVRIEALRVEREAAAAAQAQSQAAAVEHHAHELERKWAAYIEDQRTRNFPDAQLITSRFHAVTKRRAILRSFESHSTVSRDVLAYDPTYEGPRTAIRVDSDLQVHTYESSDRGPDPGWRHAGSLREYTMRLGWTNQLRSERVGDPPVD